MATAIHDGHAVRFSLLDSMVVSEAERLRDEDPHTAELAMVGDVRVVVATSRFEVDLNRSREKAVYRTPEDAWGLDVWRRPPEGEELALSLAAYDAFYAAMADLLSRIQREHGAFILLDLHSYNHMRGGPNDEPADPATNPVINVGTGNTDRSRWSELIDRFIGDLAAFDTGGESLDVRENVKFRGGHFTRWVHERFPDSSCCLAIEFKKTFMDEWTGRLDETRLDVLREALASTLPGVRKDLSAGRI
ncbi:N-formylglutamate amidohydrolase [bacterium]|nr:N-formylglutamate amidohydrolase [bacterium]